jgi:dienelactone hydrolase
MFGEGVAGNRERMMACLTGLRDDPQRMSRRAQAGLAALAGCAEADGRFAAVGFCFGGLAVLTLARSGADVMGVVSMHGSLATVRPAEPDAVRAKVLVCHGALDPHVPLADVVGFAEEMGHARADWQLIMYGGAVHGFTHEHATPGAIPGVAYDAPADRRSFAAALAFLAEALPPTAPHPGTARSTR